MSDHHVPPAVCLAHACACGPGICECRTGDEICTCAPLDNRTPARYVSLEEIAHQRAHGWPDFHPEHYCHRCGRQNTNWYVDGASWATVMRAGDPDAWGEWQEIICIPCFIELAEPHYGRFVWHIDRDEHGLERLSRLDVDRSTVHAAQLAYAEACDG